MGAEPSRIVVTGGTGFVGRHLMPALVAAYPAADIVATSHGDGIATPGSRTLECDLRDAAAVDAAIATLAPDAVLHLAAQASVAQSLQGGLETWAVNVGGTLNLARAISRHAPAALLLFVSTAEVYGLSFRDGIAGESTPPSPANAYARSKFAAEAMLADVLPAGTQLLVARPCNQSGPGQDERFVVPAFAAQVARIERGEVEPVVRAGDLTPIRDFLHVADVVDAYLALIAAAPGLPQRATYNISSGQGHSVGDILSGLREVARKPFGVEVDPARLRPNDVPIAIADSSALTQATGWRPKRSFDEMIADVLAFERSERSS